MNEKKKDHDSIENESWDKELPDKTGLGALLREHRQKKGLDVTQVSESTRLRPHYLEALEREDWDILPAPVFVTGFIRAYAHALGVDEEKALALYHSTAPVEPDLPLPLKEYKKNKKTVMLLPVVVVLMALAAYTAWQTRGPAPDRFEKPEPPTQVTAHVPPPDPPPEPDVKPASTETAGPSDTESGSIEKGVSNAPVAPASPSEDQPEGSPSKDTRVSKTDGESTAFTPVSQGALSATETEETQDMVLKADILERSWVRILIDDQEPKEYIFSPGTHTSWKAKKGFEVLIGNAGGVLLEYNDEKIEKLGDSGRVVRLKFPKDFKREEARD